ncbi:PIN-like domain-containing protein [Priestia aryabhattai]|uniref:PIN-like domain-containing protein n=1 Tax=Priestia aryabhattai TaxID=412384 RepID=UPI003D2DFFED
MRNMFLKDYPYTEKEYNDIWQNCIFVVDANVLLNLYRYTKETRNELLDILTQLSERLWIPHQVGLEYHSNRTKVIIEQIEAFDKLIRLLDSSSQAVVKSLNDGGKDFKKRHPSIQLDSLTSNITEYIGTLIESTKGEKQAHPNFLEKDIILDKITELFDGKVGPSYDQKTLDEIFAKGKERYEEKIPPGYKDLSTKEGSVKYYNDLIIKDEYGDLIVWKQILDKAEINEVPIVFITDDSKEDWWNIINGRTIGPRYELINEFTFQTQQRLIMYNTQRFMNFASSFLESTLSEKAIEEMQKLTEANEDTLEELLAKQEMLLREERDRYRKDRLKRLFEEIPIEKESSSSESKKLVSYHIPQSVIKKIHQLIILNSEEGYVIDKAKTEIIVKGEIYKIFDKPVEKYLLNTVVTNTILLMIEQKLIFENDFETYSVVPF